MKKPISFLCVLPLAFSLMFSMPLPADAQTPGVLTLSNGGTNSVILSSSNSYTFAVSEFENVGLQVKLKADAAGTSTVLYSLWRSADSTDYETAPFSTGLITLNGTTFVTTFTNLYVPSSGTVKLILQNTNAALNVSNVTAKVRYNAPKRKSSS